MRTTLIALSALALVAGAPAAAKDFVVAYKDLDLSTAKGQKTLDKRIDAAARVYCGMDVQMTGSRTKGRGAGECFASARDAAREQMASLIEKAQRGG